MSARSNKKSLIVSNLAQVVPPPKEDAPKPPSGFDPNVQRGRGLRPWAALVNLAPKIAEELTASSTFAEDFGARQSPAVLAETLQQCSAWRGKRTEAAAWFHYVATEDAIAWRVAIRQIERLRKAFDYAVSCDPSIATRYPQTTEVLRARSAISERAAKTAKERKAQKAEAAASSVAPTPAAEAPKA